MKKIAIFASGSGTNAENIARHFADSDKARVTLVLTNVRDAGVVGRMRALGIDTYYVPNSEWKGNPVNIADFLQTEGIDLVVLAGFMRKVDDVIVDRFRGRLLNIHPSLLPAYGGKGMYGRHVHEAVIAAGEKESGVTVHQVNEQMDEGEIVAQEKVSIDEGDTASTLEAKIHKVEYSIYPRAIEKVLGITDNGESAEESKKPEGSVASQWAEALGVTYKEEEGSEKTDESATTMPPAYQEPPVYNPQSQEYSQNQQYQQPEQQFQQPFQPYQQPEQQFGQPMPEMNCQAPAAECERKMPSTYLLWSVLTLVFCCTITGIVATVFSCQVSSRFYNGDYEGAERANRRAQLWIIISFCLGVLQATIFTPLYMLAL